MTFDEVIRLVRIISRVKLLESQKRNHLASSHVCPAPLSPTGEDRGQGWSQDHHSQQLSTSVQRKLLQKPRKITRLKTTENAGLKNQKSFLVEFVLSAGICDQGSVCGLSCRKEKLVKKENFSINNLGHKAQVKLGSPRLVYLPTVLVPSLLPPRSPSRDYLFTTRNMTFSGGQKSATKTDTKRTLLWRLESLLQ